MTLEELMLARNGKIAEQQAIVDKAKAENSRSLTDEENQEFAKLQREIDELTSQINQKSAKGEEEPPIAVPGDMERALALERQRVAEIGELCREFGMEEQEKEFIKNGTTVENVRAAVIENLRKNGAPVSTNGRAEVTKDEADKFRAAAADALIMRSGMTLEKPSEGARELMGMSLRDLGIECLASEGETGLNRKSAEEIYGMLGRQFYNPTAAFPAILDNAINKAYVEGHKTVAVTFDEWVKKGSLKDFKTHDNNYIAGPAGEFIEVPENGELKHDVFGDAKRPTRKLKTYGRQFTLTRQAFINDDIDLVTRIPAKYAASARKTQNK